MQAIAANVRTARRVYIKGLRISRQLTSIPHKVHLCRLPWTRRVQRLVISEATTYLALVAADPMSYIALSDAMAPVPDVRKKVALVYRDVLLQSMLTTMLHDRIIATLCIIALSLIETVLSAD